MTASKPQSRRLRRSRRYREVARILWEERVFALLRASGMDREAPGAVPTAAEEARSSAAAQPAAGAGAHHAPPEVRLRRALERLGPAFVKVGQLLSTRRDLIPPALAAELATLQDHVATLPWEQMERTLVEQLGARPDELYAEFDPECIASASIGQVYRARLHDGRAVVVKIQRPGAAEVMEADFDILLAQTRFAAHHSEWARAQNLAAIAEAIVHVLRAELDYTLEAHNMATFRAAFEGNPDVFFPAPIWDLTTARVLTMELVEGIPGTRTNELRAAGVDTARMVQSGVDCYFHQIFDLGIYHADPHAGNLFSMPNGRVGFVDFGRVGTVSRQHRRAIFEMLLAVMDDDPADAADALLSICTADPSVDLSALQEDLDRVVSLYRQSQHRPDVLQLTLQETLTTMRRHKLAVSADVVQLLTTLGVLEGVASQIHPGFAVIEAAQPFAQRQLARSFSPRVWHEEAMHALRRYRKLIEELPLSLTRALRRAGEGEFRLGVRPEGYEDALHGLQEIVERLAFAILVAAFVLAFAYIAAQDGLPDWVQWLAAAVLGLSALAAFWLLGSIMLATRRRRRARRRR